MALVIGIHVFSCVLLIVIVLIQRGRGSGLVESFAGVESMFGTKTSAFLTRTTTILSVVFFLTCLSLAILSVRQSKSLMRNLKSSPASTTAQEAVPAQSGAAVPDAAPVQATEAERVPESTQETP
ncbi:MAG: preprotein translocase subunit SecG [Candidatus Omnitrophica bacterium]|nr:preprotein translocase subunit SecG [Candidatus Omnitrophota bacterium]